MSPPGRQAVRRTGRGSAPRVRAVWGGPRASASAPAGAPCAAAGPPAAGRGFFVGGQQRQRERLGPGQGQPTVGGDVDLRLGVGGPALRVGGTGVPDLPALTGASVAPVEGAALPAELAHVSALGDVAPRRTGDAGDRRDAEAV